MLTLTHNESDRAFDYRVELSGLEPGTETPTIEFRRGSQVFATVSAGDDPEARIDDSGVFRGGLSQADLPIGDGEFVAEVTEPEECAGTTATFDPLEFE